MQTSYIPTWMAFKPQLLIHPTYDVVSRDYQRYRIPRPPDEAAAGSAPGLICWGSVGAMPTAEPAPTVDFNVAKETWTETKRKSDIVRVENPDDPSQYVMEDRPKSLKFNKSTNNAPPGPNTSAKPAPGMSDYTVAQRAQFVSPAGGAGSTSGVTVNYSSGRIEDGHGPR